MWRAMFSHFHLVPFLAVLSILQVEVTRADFVNPGCNHTCGDVIIPYPFGIGKGCFYDEWFEIDCKPTSPNSNGVSILKPFLSKFNFEIMEVYNGYLPSVKVGMTPMNVCSVDTHQQIVDLRGSPYDFSREQNVFVMGGCSGSAYLLDQTETVMAGCATICSNNNNNSNNSNNNNNNNNNKAIHINKNCYGVHCCQTLLPSESDYDHSPFKFYNIDFNNQSSGEGEHQNCLWGTIMESDYVGNLSSSDPSTRVPVVLLWSLTTSKLHPAYSFYSNGPNSRCSDDEYGRSSCNCGAGYYGNPYLSNGCRVAQECKNCRGYCSGSWDITGRLTSKSFYCDRDPALKLAAILGLSISFGIVLLVIGVYGLYRFIKRRREIRRRAKFFKRNGGLLLQQQLSSNEGVVERTRIFSMSELDKATDHFNENRILGQGGQGTVYKGMLINGEIVAIKKAKLLDESQLEQFINEVVILSQINHRNVVKLLGCCLETEIPLLVYEFIPNGTLFQHIHDPDEEFMISWEMCLKIAADSAAAIAYLHSSASIPIYHRDIKSSNILLDEKHKAKVSDFGSSRTIAIDQTHMTTLVQGTMGYLDPEYFQSYQFTEKSDVYSFGVVLLELLTRKKPIYREENTMEQKNLATEFLFLTQNSRLSNIMDPIIVRDAKEDELMAIVELTKRCISWSGKLRPTMKEVAMTLEMIIKSPAQVSRWYQEQEPFPISEGGFDEYAMNDISDVEFFSSTVLAGSSSPPYNDVNPLLLDNK